MQSEERRRLCVSLFGEEATREDSVAQIESQLDVVLPTDFKEISSFYGGGIVGGISHNAFAASGPVDNLVEETKKLRVAVDLPRSMVVLAEPAESLIVLDTGPQVGAIAVIWLDATDVRRLHDVKSLRNPQVWSCYADFFDFLLSRELEERNEDN